jgi:hypothetical protein
MEHSAVMDVVSTPLPMLLSMLLPAHFGGFGEEANNLLSMLSVPRNDSARLPR